MEQILKLSHYKRILLFNKLYIDLFPDGEQILSHSKFPIVFYKAISNLQQEYSFIPRDLPGFIYEQLGTSTTDKFTRINLEAVADYFKDFLERHSFYQKKKIDVEIEVVKKEIKDYMCSFKNFEEKEFVFTALKNDLLKLYGIDKAKKIKLSDLNIGLFYASEFFMNMTFTNKYKEIIKNVVKQPNNDFLPNEVDDSFFLFLDFAQIIARNMGIQMSDLKNKRREPSEFLTTIFPRMKIINNIEKEITKSNLYSSKTDFQKKLANEMGIDPRNIRDYFTYLGKYRSFRIQDIYYFEKLNINRDAILGDTPESVKLSRPLQRIQHYLEVVDDERRNEVVRILTSISHFLSKIQYLNTWDHSISCEKLDQEIKNKIKEMEK